MQWGRGEGKRAKISYIGAKGAFRKILRLFGAKWISQTYTKGNWKNLATGIGGGGGGRETPPLSARYCILFKLTHYNLCSFWPLEFLPIPIYAIYKVCVTDGDSLRDKVLINLRPSKDWGPSDPEDRARNNQLVWEKLGEEYITDQSVAPTQQQSVESDNWSKVQKVVFRKSEDS